MLGPGPQPLQYREEPEVDRRVASAYRDALAHDERQKWADQGWMLVWPAAHSHSIGIAIAYFCI